MRDRCKLPHRGRTAAAAVVAGLVLSVAGCSGGGDSDDGADDSKPSSGQDEKGGGGGASRDDAGGASGPLAQVKGEDGIALEIKSAERDEGGFVTVTGSITNSTGEFWLGGAWKSDEKELGDANPASVAAAKLVDKKGKKRYLILRDTEGKCLCTNFNGGLQDGKSKSWYAQFPAPPKGNDRVDFQIGDMPPAEITLSDGE